jgi:SEC-C motif-containing protein
MRSRYTAYATSDLNHIMVTTHPQSPHYQEDRNAWLEDIRSFCQTTTFEKLEVQFTRANGEQGWVQFTAQLRQGKRSTSMQENSEFIRVEGQWLYVRGIETDG